MLLTKFWKTASQKPKIRIRKQAQSDDKTNNGEQQLTLQEREKQACNKEEL
jgi:hypothetical protein